MMVQSGLLDDAAFERSFAEPTRMTKPMPWYYTVNDRPVMVVPTRDGGADVLAMNLHNGEFVRELHLLSRVMTPEGDVDELDETTFAQRVASIRATLGPSRYQRALLLASELHATQMRKGTSTPYLAHLLGVASTTMEHGGNEDEAIAALLHDAVEDQGGAATAKRIRHDFGDRVADLVLALSDSTTEPKPPWRARKEAYLAHLATTDDGVRLVSMADKLYNAQSIVRDLRAQGASIFARFTGGRDGTLWYYDALVATYERTSSKGSALLAELRAAVTEMHRLA